MSGIDLGPEVGDAFDAMGQFTDTVAGDVRDPYPDFVQKRRETPVEVTVNVGFDGEESPVCTVYTYDLVAQVLRDNVTFSSGVVRELMEVVMGPFVLVGMDEPEHKRHRALVSAAFRQKTLAEGKPGVSARITGAPTNRSPPGGGAEWFRDFPFHSPA